MGREVVHILHSSMKRKGFMPKSCADVCPLFPRVRRSAAVRCRVTRFRCALLVLLAGMMAVASAGCRSNKLPDRSSKTYAEAVSAFYVGLAALQVGDDVHAESKLAEVAQLVPAEPAGWANWG